MVVICFLSSGGGFTFHMSFCTALEIPHYFCEIKQMVQLACSDTFLNNVVMYLGAGLLGTTTIAGILYSYSKSFLHTSNLISPREV